MMEREMQMKSVKKFRAFLGGFILFLALMFTVGSVNVKAAAPKLNKKKITIYVGHAEVGVFSDQNKFISTEVPVWI